MAKIHVMMNCLVTRANVVLAAVPNMTNVDIPVAIAYADKTRTIANQLLEMCSQECGTFAHRWAMSIFCKQLQESRDTFSDVCERAKTDKIANLLDSVKKMHASMVQTLKIYGAFDALFAMVEQATPELLALSTKEKIHDAVHARAAALLATL